MSTPTISVDRAVAHYTAELAVDTEALQQYYEDLPHPDKRPLEECRIHVSALLPYSPRHTFRGIGLHLRDPERSREIDPQAPPANILLFLGAHAANSSIDFDKVLKHELVHYAQTEPPQPSVNEEAIALRLALALNQGKIAKALWVAKAALYGAAFEGALAIIDTAPDIKLATGYGIGVATFDSLLKRKRKRKRITEIRKKLHDLYVKGEREEDATQHTLSDVTILTMQPSQTEKLKPLVRYPKGNHIGNKLADAAHKSLSLTPPSASFSSRIARQQK